MIQINPAGGRVARREASRTGLQDWTEADEVMKSGWTSFFPPAQWLAGYRASWLPSDIAGGVTLAAYGIPVSLAYAALAGLPPQLGIYGYMLGGIG